MRLKIAALSPNSTSRLFATIAAAAVLSLSAQPDMARAQLNQNMMKGPQLARAMREGGMILYMRHGRTEKDYPDQAAGKARMGNCNTQRVLSEKGFNQVRKSGAAIKWLDTPVGQVIASRYCRAFKTAALTFGHYTKNPDLNFAESDADGEYSDAKKKQMEDNLTPLLSRKPLDGMNIALVGHDDPFAMATGIYPEPSGTVHVVKPEGDGNFQVIGKIAPDEWQTLGAPPETHNDR